MAYTRVLSILFALVIFFVSCKKEDLPGTGDNLLSRVVSDNDSLMSASFFYDAQNRLIKVVDSIRSGHQWETTIAYDAAGNPKKLATLRPASSNIVAFAVIDSLVYENGRAVRKYQDWPFSPHAGHFILTHNYVYDAKGRLTKDIGGQTTDISDAGWHQSFTYDADDNLIKTDENYFTQGIISTTLTYNSQLNPYHNMGLVLYFAKGDNLFLGKHNKARTVRQMPNAGLPTTDYNYEHDASGLLKKMIITRRQAGAPDNTSTFELYYR